MASGAAGGAADETTGAAAGRSFVGFGFGPIMAGLFLCEAQRSGAFARLAVAYRRPDVIAAVRRAGGRIVVNVAHAERIERVEVGPVELYDVNRAGDRAALIAEIAAADEIATALSGVRDYVSDAGPGSVHRLLARGLERKLDRGGSAALVYAAENHHGAAALLRAAVESELPAAFRPRLPRRVQFLDTVIGKMSGTIPGSELGRRGLGEIAPGLERAFLVEAFDRILIERVRLTGAASGFASFAQRDDLRPFEEAKLYGHNAAHALLAYLGRIAGLRDVAAARTRPELLDFVRAAFLEESGAALIARHAGRDPLFEPAGFARFADDLLARMTNPLLGDSVERVGRDPERKLGWDDRLIGTMRLALSQEIEPRRFALGAAAALEVAGASGPPAGRRLLDAAWSGADPDPDERARIVGLIDEERPHLRRWRLRAPEGNRS